jgi:hypothetical protein
MSDPASTIGSSRTATVLDPAFVDGLSGLSTDEVRRRRDESLAEREFLPYLRRLLQVRQDVLSAERGRLHSGDEPQSLVDRLTAVLSKGGKSNGTRGEALRTILSEADIEEAQRQADAMLPGMILEESDELGEEELGQAIRSLATAERAVSSRRTAVMRVHDRLQDELKRRYRDDPGEIPTDV